VAHSQRLQKSICPIGYILDTPSNHLAPPKASEDIEISRVRHMERTGHSSEPIGCGVFRSGKHDVICVFCCDVTSGRKRDVIRGEKFFCSDVISCGKSDVICGEKLFSSDVTSDMKRDVIIGGKREVVSGGKSAWRDVFSGGKLARCDVILGGNVFATGAFFYGCFALAPDLEHSPGASC